MNTETRPDSAASSSPDARVDWWHRDHPTFTALTGFFSGMLFITVIPGGFASLLRLLFDYNTAEERAAAYIRDHLTKPVVGYIAGFTAPDGKTMGHAGAIVSGSSGTAQAKKEALEAAGVRVGGTPTETAQLVLAVLATAASRHS